MNTITLYQRSSSFRFFCSTLQALIVVIEGVDMEDESSPCAKIQWPKRFLVS